MYKKITRNSLMILGIAPFFALAIVIVFFNMPQNIHFKAQVFFNLYALVIAVFISGSHWGLLQAATNRHIPVFLVITNVLSLLLWCTYGLLRPPLFYYVIGIIYLILLSIDYNLLKIGCIRLAYFKLRLMVTCAVLLLIVIVGATR